MLPQMFWTLGKVSQADDVFGPCRSLAAKLRASSACQPIRPLQPQAREIQSGRTNLAQKRTAGTLGITFRVESHG